MLHSLKEIIGLSIGAKDGDLGTVEDFYFDDVEWTIRYLVVGTGGLLTGRSVLIPLHALTGANWAEEILQVSLTKQQVKDSPGVDTAKPVSRQHEMEVLNHYGYSHYWTGPYLWGKAFLPSVIGNEPSDEPDLQGIRKKREQPCTDAHLRSFNEVTGYQIQATDDTAGHIDDFMVDDKDWSIRLISVDTQEWLPGKNVLLSPERIRDIIWSDGKVTVNLSREEVENSPEFDPANAPPLGPKYDLYRRFGMPHS